MKAYLELYSQQLSIIEDLARQLFQVTFEGPQDLWKFEIAIAKHQIELQEEIAREKTSKQETNATIAEIASNRENDWKKQLKELNNRLRQAEDRISIYSQAYMISRQLGDALAWLLLKRDGSTIVPLTENMPVPPISPDMGLAGMLAVAEIYADAGAGFPIIHDITNCLRVGDITFVHPDDEPITIEVKTHVLNREGGTARLSVETYATTGAERWKTIHLEITDPLPDKKVIRKPMNPSNRRLDRQLERMSRATIVQTALHTAQSGELIDVRGKDHLLVRPELDSRAHHWDVMRELTIKAKANGYASCIVDDAFVYVATYTDLPKIYPWSRSTDIHLEGILRADDIGDKFPMCSETDHNCIWFELTWRYFSDKLSDSVPPPICPFFLYPIPFDLLIDIMWGRLSVMVVVNLGKLVEAVENSGFTARLPKDDEFIGVSTKISLSDGNQVEIHLGSLHMLGMQIVFEFLSVKGFVDIVSQMVNDATELVKTKQKSDVSQIK